MTLNDLLQIALYLAATWWAKKKSDFNWWLAGSALGLAAVALAFSGWFLSFATLAHRPWLMFGFVFLIDLGITALALFEKRLAPAQSLAGLGVFTETEPRTFGLNPLG